MCALVSSTCFGSGALRPPPPVVAALASSLRTPSRGDPPLRGRGGNGLPRRSPLRGRGVGWLTPDADAAPDGLRQARAVGASDGPRAIDAAGASHAPRGPGAGG